MIDWTILSRKFERLGAARKFEVLALKYVSDIYSEYTWIPTQTTVDENKDAHLGKGTEFDVWEEAKFKGKNYKIRRQDLDTTILSGLLQGNVRMIVFVSNALVPEHLYSRADVTAKMKGIEITYVLDAQLESWLINHPDVYKDIFEEEITIKASSCPTQEVHDVFVYDTTSTEFKSLSENTELIVGEKYILSLAISSSVENSIADVSFVSSTAPFSILESPAFSRPNGIILKKGMNVVELLVAAIAEYNNRVSVKINIDGKPYFGITQHLLIQGNNNLRIVYSKQIEILHRIKSFVSSNNTTNSAFVFTIFAESGMGKSYILNSIYLDYLFKRDIACIDFEMAAINNSNYQLLCKVLLYLNFGNIFLYSDINNEDDRNRLKIMVGGAKLNNCLSKQDLLNLVDGCYDITVAMTIIKHLVLKCRRNKNYTIVSTVNGKISKLLLLDDIQYLNDLQYEVISIICNQCEKLNKRITLILSGTKDKFESLAQEQAFKNLSVNSFCLEGLTPLDKFSSIKNIICEVEDNDLDIINSIIPNSPLLAHEVICNIKMMDSTSNLFQLIENYNYGIEGNAIFQNKFISLKKQEIELLDIIYMFKLGIYFGDIITYYNSKALNIKPSIEKLEKSRLIIKKEGKVKPYHDYCTTSYLKYRNNKMFNGKTAAFLEFLLKHNGIDENLAISNLIKCGKRYYTEYKKRIDNIILSSIHSTNFGIALYYCEYYYNYLINRNSNSYSKEELYLLYLYADCLVHCGKNDEAEKQFEWLCEISNPNTIEYIEAKASLLNQWFWHLKIDRLIADSCILQVQTEKLLSSDLDAEDYIRISKAEETYHNRRMVTQLLLDQYDDAYFTYKNRIIDTCQKLDRMNFRKESATIIMDYARGISYHNPQKAYKIMNVAKNFFNDNFYAQYRRALLCNIDFIVLSCINKREWKEEEFEKLLISLKNEKFYFEYFKAILKYYACKIIDESKMLEASKINNYKTTTVQNFYNEIHKCMIEINNTPEYREKYLYNVLIAYVHILNKQFDKAESCLNQACEFISKAGSSYLRSINHNMDNMYSIKSINWCLENKELNPNCYYLDPRFW